MRRKSQGVFLEYGQTFTKAKLTVHGNPRVEISAI